MKIKFLGKCVLIEEENILVVGDLHLGYFESIRRSGIFVPNDFFVELKKDFEEIFLRTGKLDKIILLGDVKHEFGKILREEWKEVLEMIDFLRENCEELVIVKGNHDVFTNFMTKKKGLEILDYYIWKDFCFVHGDRGFEEMNEKKIKFWFMGHAHPALKLKEGVKIEKYKCFLDGKYKGKRVIILPSFFSVNEGSDLRELSSGLAWDFNLKNFKVCVVGENLEVYDFGKLGKIE